LLWFGSYSGQGTWSVGRLAAAEKALQGRPLTACSLVAALRAARQGFPGACQDFAGGDAHPLMAQLADAILLTSLAPLVEKV